MAITTRSTTRKTGRITKQTFRPSTLPITRSQTTSSSSLSKNFRSLNLHDKQITEQNDSSDDPMSEDENLDNDAFNEYRYSRVASEDDDNDDRYSDEEVNPHGANLPEMRSMLTSTGALPSTAAVLETQQVTPGRKHTEKQHKRYGENLTRRKIKKILENVRLRGMTHAKAAQLAETSKANVTRIINEHKNSGDPYPKKKTRTAVGTIDNQGSEFIENFVKEQNTASLKQIQQAYQQKFDSVVSVSTLHRHLTQVCRLTVKRAGWYPERRTNEDTKRMREKWVRQYIHSDQIDYEKNCIFIDESAFNASMRRNYGRSKIGQPVRIKVKTKRAPSVTLLAAICNDGLVEATLRLAAKKGSKKKEKGKNREKAARKTKNNEDENDENDNSKGMKQTKGTNSHDFLAFLHMVMDRLEQQNRAECNFVFDNAPIHNAGWIVEAVEKRGHHVVMLPRYSPFLNPIEEYFSKIKALCKSAPIREVDDKESNKPETEKRQEELENRIAEAMAQVTPSDYKGWVRHAISFFPRCIAHEDDL